MASADPVTEIFGHADVRRDLDAAIRRGDLPGSLLVHGPPGVGRQTLARWLARRLVCPRAVDGGPCGECRDCRLALDLQHPDIHWFFPLPRPKGAASPEKLAESLETARFEALADRRGDPLYLPDDDEPTGLYLAQVRTIRRLAANRPAMATQQVFIIGNAELLVPQEASEEAANALLKVLEEPSPATTFVLTAREPDSLLSTLRSRLLPVRLRPFDVAAITTFLQQRAGVDPATADVTARLGDGSIGRALAFLPGADGVAPARQVRDRAIAWVEAALDPSGGPRYAAALAQRPGGARGTFSDTLAAVTLWLRDLAAVAAGAEEQVADPGELQRLRALAARIRPDGVPGAIHLVEEARDGGRINANPQLTLTWLLNGLATQLRA